MPTITDVWSALAQRLDHQRIRLGKIRARRDELRAAYEEYRDLTREMEDRTESVKRIGGLLGPKGLSGSRVDIRAIIQEALDGSLPLDDLRKQLTLWEALFEYLSCVDEAQVDDIRSFCTSVGVKTSRASLESALKTHANMFRIMKRGKQKWLALKKG